MSDPAIKQRLRKTRDRITMRLSRQGFEVFYDCCNRYRLMAVKRGQIKIIDLTAEAKKSQAQNLVKGTFPSRSRP